MKAIIIDDEFWIRNSIRHLADWERFGIDQVMEAEDGLSGLEMVERLHPEIVITDMKMRGMDGTRLLQKLTEEYPYIRKIVISGFDEFSYMKQAILSKVDEYLLKPIKPEELNRALEKAVRELRAAQGIHAAQPLDKQLLKVVTETRSVIVRYIHEMNPEAISISFKHLEAALKEHEPLKPGVSNSLYKQFMQLLEEQADLLGSELTPNAQSWAATFFVSDNTPLSAWITVLSDAFSGSLEALIYQRKNKVGVKIDEIRQFIDHSYAEPIGLGTIASQFFISREHLSRTFKQEVGLTVMDYLVSKRIEKACELLQDPSVLIKNAAKAVGYSDITYFYRIFKKITGVTPIQFRQGS
ncbi:hypothetical protein GCM10008018_18260 [Paenibacillus marchantiophytorum]|uniref:Response regulator n=1 Tax=Paenibacillus marchantiophytorum TaxID=1619310 RepID=A0ABQ2BSM2_9BACL|nr:helix-turn-helix domain-containing protein [Paenibacillus marchantiophytorum]GGI46671.1 hypothetical protein GCM10008018_18260 [Paenibacillus marchantiophytorum]